MPFNMKRRDFVDIIRQNSKKSQVEQSRLIFEQVTKSLGNATLSVQQSQEVQGHLKRYCSEVSQRWERSGRSEKKFLERNAEWLEKDTFPPDLLSSQKRSGRSGKCFDDSSVRVKRRKTVELRRSKSTSELMFATHVKLHSEGKRTAAKLISDIEGTSSKAIEMKKDLNKSEKPGVKEFTEDEALSLKIDGKLTKSQYQLIRSQSKERNADIFPSIKRLSNAQARCYPDENSISVSEISGEVKVQALLDHTAARLIQVQEPVISGLPANEVIDLVLLSKYGFDGSSGQSQYKQRSSIEGFSDSDLFLTSLVPLQLYAQKDKSGEKNILWHNSRSSSTKLCRPIRFQFIKETAAISKQEKEYVEKQIEQLVPTEVTTSSGIQMKISHKLLLTMIDGKVCNAITETASAQKCFICNAKPTEMNNLNQIEKREITVENIQFGLSPLHAHIRFFECLLHIAYRLDLKVWQVRAKNKAEMNQRKFQIQQDFRSKMGLLVDLPKPGGSGTTNDGNTARRFFKNPALSSEITGIDEELISRFAVVLSAISSSYEINAYAFDSYANETAKLFVNLYGWYHMPVSVHKVLVHGSAIISAALLPIGQLSEEAQEARNKDCKRYRENHTRKHSRIATNQDLLHLLLISSDPVISSMRNHSKKGREKLSSDVLKLLETPDITPSTSGLNLIQPDCSTEESSCSSSDDE